MDEDSTLLSWMVTQTEWLLMYSEKKMAPDQAKATVTEVPSDSELARDTSCFCC